MNSLLPTETLSCCNVLYSLRRRCGHHAVPSLIAYVMPTEPLRDFVGPVGMYGHMNDILVENMALFKTYAEGVELADVQAARAEDRADMAEDNRAFWQQFRVRTPRMSRLQTSWAGLCCAASTSRPHRIRRAPLLRMLAARHAVTRTWKRSIQNISR